jgi:hypothetical protein
VCWRHHQGHEGRVVGGAIVRWCSKQDVLRWTHRLLKRAHPWPHQDGVGLGIVEGGPRQGVDARVVVVRAVVLTLPLPLAFAAIVGGGSRRGGAIEGHDGSCCSGRGGSYCYRGCPPPKGVE